MARGGYIGAAIALKRVFVGFETIERAKGAFRDALIAGSIAARGGRWIEDAGEETDSDPGFILRDISAGIDGKYGEPEDIPPEFWSGISHKDFRDWDWQSGHFFNSAAELSSYGDVAFRERDINGVLKKLEGLRSGPSTTAPSKKSRLKDASWEEWIAAVACLAYEQQISPGMKQVDLISRVHARLAAWGIAEMKEVSTIAPAVGAIRRRFASNPPVRPVPIG